MIENRRKKYSFIIYEGESVPRYFEMSKSLFRFLLYGLPAWSFAAMVVLLSTLVYFNEIRDKAKRTEPEIIRQLKGQVDELAQAKEDLSTENKGLLEKLTQSGQQSEFPALALYKVPYGAKSITNPPILNIENIQIVPENGKVMVRFNLVNLTTENRKLAGYIHIALKTKDALYFFPSKRVDEYLNTFDQGEPFATSRFRPVEAIFPPLAPNEDYLLNILIFSRTGDIIHRKVLRSDMVNN